VYFGRDEMILKSGEETKRKTIEMIRTNDFIQKPQAIN